MRTVKVWDIFVRTFHWTLVVSVIGLFISGEEFESVHIRLGYFVTFLVLARVVWGFIGTKHARFSDFLYPPSKIYQYLKGLVSSRPDHYLGHNPAGGLMVIILLLSLLLTSFTGLKILAAKGKGPLANGYISMSKLAYADEDKSRDHDFKGRKRNKGEKEDDLWEDIHESMTSFIILLTIIHFSGVIVSSWAHKENLILAMITGTKKIS